MVFFSHAANANTIIAADSTIEYFISIPFKIPTTRIAFSDTAAKSPRPCTDARFASVYGHPTLTA